MTIDEAKTKICPFMSNSVIRTNDYIKNSSSLSCSACLVDKCMAWKFAEEFETKESGITVSTGKQSKTHGYCKRIENESIS